MYTLETWVSPHNSCFIVDSGIKNDINFISIVSVLDLDINQERKGGKVKNDNHNLKPIFFFFTKFRVVFNKVMKKS